MGGGWWDNNSLRWLIAAWWELPFIFSCSSPLCYESSDTPEVEKEIVQSLQCSWQGATQAAQAMLALGVSPAGLPSSPSRQKYRESVSLLFPWTAHAGFWNVETGMKWQISESWFSLRSASGKKAQTQIQKLGNPHGSHRKGTNLNLKLADRLVKQYSRQFLKSQCSSGANLSTSTFIRNLQLSSWGCSTEPAAERCIWGKGGACSQSSKRGMESHFCLLLHSHCWDIFTWAQKQRHHRAQELYQR